MRNIFCLTWADYEHENDYYFLAPEGVTEEEDFKKLCHNLLEEAVVEACRVKGYTWDGASEDPETHFPSFWIGWGSLVHVLAFKLLPKHGYQRVSLPTVRFTGTSIIRDKECDNIEGFLSEKAFDIIAKYNSEIDKDENFSTTT